MKPQKPVNLANLNAANLANPAGENPANFANPAPSAHLSPSLSSLAQSCVKCAKCVPACTIYQIHRDETTSPRGFIDLLGAYEKRDLVLDKNLKNILESCFLCTTCTTLCPQVIDTATMIQAARVDIAQKFGIAWFKRAYFFLLKHRKLMDFVFSFVAFLAPCAFQKSGENADKMRSRFSLGALGRRTIFPFQKRSFLQKYKGWVRSKNAPDSPDSRLDSPQDSRILQDSVAFSPAKTAKNPAANPATRPALNLAANLSANPAQNPAKAPPSQPTPPRKVAIFIGCLSNYNYTQVGESLLFVLDFLGIDALIPPQECCGAPAYFTGDVMSVNVLAKKNIALFEGFFDEVEALLVPEATCAAMIAHDWAHSLRFDPEGAAWIARLERLLPKIFMASEFLYKHTDLLSRLESRPKIATKITYHDPCHAKKVLKIAAEPRAFLGANYDLVEMKECDRCCGFGGVTIQSEKYHLAHAAGLPKAQNIADSGAAIVSAECSACRMQLNNAIDAAGGSAIFKHPLELIAAALGRSA